LAIEDRMTSSCTTFNARERKGRGWLVVGAPAGSYDRIRKFLRAHVEALGQLPRAVRHSRRRGLALVGLSNNQPAPARPVEPKCARKEIENAPVGIQQD